MSDDDILILLVLSFMVLLMAVGLFGVLWEKLRG
jgi:hypothetical protein